MLTKDVILTERKSEFLEISISNIEPSPYQPRTHFSDEGIEALAKTFRNMGILEPLCVRKKQGTAGTYELVAGERRLRAAKLIGMTTVPCVIAHYSDEEAAQASLIENTSREDLDPISKARAMDRLIKEFQYQHDELADILGISRSNVTNQLRLLKLDARIQLWLEQGHLTESHGEVLAGLKYDQQYSLAYKCLSHGWSIRMLEKAVLEVKNGKQPTDVKLALSDEIMALANEALAKLVKDYECNADIIIHKNGAGQMIIKFANPSELEDLSQKIISTNSFRSMFYKEKFQAEVSTPSA